MALSALMDNMPTHDEFHSVASGLASLDKPKKCKMRQVVRYVIHLKRNKEVN